MSMNQWLASIYGTGASDEDIEKTAQANLLSKLAEESNVDLSQFTPEEIQALAAEILGEGAQAPQAGAPAGAPMQFNPAAQLPQAGLPQQAPQGPQAFAPAAQAQQQPPAGMQGFQMAQANQAAQDPAALQKEAQAKFEEADFLGRVMAHAYTQELEKIAAQQEKTAGRFGAAKDALKGAVSSAKNRAGNIAERAGAKASSKLTEVGMKARHHKGAIGAAGAAAGGFAAGRMSKEASAFEKLAEMQAAELLSATGFDPSTGVDTLSQQGQQGQEIPGQQQQVNNQQMQGQVNAQTGQLGQEQGQPDVQNEEQFQEALNARSLEMLEQAGYDVNEILSRLQYAQSQGGQGQA